MANVVYSPLNRCLHAAGGFSISAQHVSPTAECRCMIYPSLGWPGSVECRFSCTTAASASATPVSTMSHPARRLFHVNDRPPLHFSRQSSSFESPVGDPTPIGIRTWESPDLHLLYLAVTPSASAGRPYRGRRFCHVFTSRPETTI